MTVKFDNVEAIGDCALSDVRGMVGWTGLRGREERRGTCRVERILREFSCKEEQRNGAVAEGGSGSTFFFGMGEACLYAN